MNTAPLIMVVDDEEGIRAALSGVLKDEGFGVLLAESGEAALDLLSKQQPELVLLDIWMPGMDGVETLKAIKKSYADLPVVMISGHATISTAMQATKLGASDFIEKPLDLDRTLVAIRQALKVPCPAGDADCKNQDTEEGITLSAGISASELQGRLIPMVFKDQKARGRKITQKTLASSAIVYGHGVHTGQKSGLSLEPLPANSGIHFSGVNLKTPVPAHADFVESTGLATTLRYQETQVSTVEHLMSALHAYGISNLLIKCNGEVPVLDGSALEFCKLFDEIGLLEQEGDWFEIKIDRQLRVGNDREYIIFEPAEHFEINYTLDYPAPLGKQVFTFTLDNPANYKEQIAGARTFGFVRDISALQKQGLGLGGRFDNFVLYGEQGPINSTLRYENEAVRHKILDLIGDIYLLGRPFAGKITACMTGHSDNLALVKEIQRTLFV